MLQNIPLRIPDVWDATWFREFVITVLGKSDVRNAVGVGLTITSDGNSVATLSADAETAGVVSAHNNDPFSHLQAFAAHNADIGAHATMGTVADLPTGAAAGSRSFVTDASATTFLSVVAGGGSNKVPVVSDGTNWIIG